MGIEKSHGRAHVQPVAIEVSHDRPRVTIRRPSDGGAPPLPEREVAPNSAPLNFREDGAPADKETAKELQRRAVVARHAAKALRSVATLNPATVLPELREHVVQGAVYAIELAACLPAHPAYLRAAGDIADARAIFRALLAQGAAGDRKALDDARAWMREYRAFLATLAAVGRSLPDGGGDDEDWADKKKREIDAKHAKQAKDGGDHAE